MEKNSYPRRLHSTAIFLLQITEKMARNRSSKDPENQKNVAAQIIIIIKKILAEKK
jgi:hypothetical protein